MKVAAIDRLIFSRREKGRGDGGVANHPADYGIERRHLIQVHVARSSGASFGR